MKIQFERIALNETDRGYIVRPEARAKDFTVVARLTVLSRES